MGAMGGLLGTSGGAAGTGFAAPDQASLLTGADVSQAGQSYAQNQDALKQQQNLLTALQGQNGIQNQSNVFNQLQGVASGTGPNPAQSMLNQATSANVSNQAALMAGQRGAGANAGLMARQAGMQGGNLQQQAVGQGATMQANQSLNALGQMGNVAGTQVANQIGATGANTSANQAEQAALLNAIAARNSASVGSQSSVNAGNTALANTQMQGQQAMIGGAMNILGGGGAKAMMPSAHGGMIPGYADGGDLGVDTSMPSTPPPSEPATSQNIGSMDTSLGSPKFGQSAPGAGGDAYSQANLGVNTQMPTIQQGPSSSFGQFLSKVDSGGSAPVASPSVAPDSGAGALYSGMTSGMMGSGAPSGPKLSSVASLAAMNHGGLVDVVVSPDEKIVPPQQVQKAAGGGVRQASKTVPGKAKVSGDDYKNDTVPMKLEPGTIVIPRSKAGNEKDAAAFVRSVLAKRGRK